MSKATHNGTCQVCGRRQAHDDKKHRLAQHGYTVTWGFFSGTCEGSWHEALEIDRSHLDETVQALGAEAGRLERMTIDDVKSITVKIYCAYEFQAKTFHSEDEWNEWRKAEGRRYGYDAHGIGSKWDGHSWSKRIAQQLGIIHGQAKLMRDHAKMLVVLANDVHGQPLTPRVPKVPTRKTCATHGCRRKPADEHTHCYRCIKWGRAV